MNTGAGGLGFAKRWPATRARRTPVGSPLTTTAIHHDCDGSAPADGADRMTTQPLLRVCHVMSADLWAGAEAQVATLASFLVGQPTVQLSAVLFNDGWLASELRRLGVDLAIVDEQAHNSAAIVSSIVRFLSGRAVDVVHTHRYKDNILGTLAAKLAGVPHVVRTVHGLPEPICGWRRFYGKACEAVDRSMLALTADRIVAVSRSTARALE